MASPRTKRVLRELKFNDGNNTCFECKQHNPQWASVPYSIWICLDCSVNHRTLGSDLSFVRSVTMDKWKDTELEKMKTGGNLKAGVFFKSQSDYREGMSIEEKYKTKAAALYRDKIATEAAGAAWNEASSPANDYKVPDVGVAGGRGSGASIDSVSSPHSEQNMDGLHVKSKPVISFARDEFIRKQMAENETRSEDLSPNQGGKYVGFGSHPAPPSSANSNSNSNSGGWDSTLSTLQGGWNFLSFGAQQLAVVTEKAVDLGSKVNESVIKPTANKASDIACLASDITVDLGSKMNENLIKPTANKASDIACLATDITVDLGSMVNEKVIKSTATKASEFACVASGKAVDLGCKVNDNVIKPTANKACELGTSVSQKATEGTLAREMQGSLKGAAETMTNVSIKSWYNLQSYLGFGAEPDNQTRETEPETPVS